MKLIISNFKWNTFDSSTEDVTQIYNIMCSLLKKNMIKINGKINPKEIIFDEQSTRIKNKLFLSSIQNKIPLIKGDPKIKEIGRDYLNTEKLTKEQWLALKDSLVGVLDRLQVNADIYIEQEGKQTYWRKGRQNVYWPEEPKTFPVKA